MSFLSISIDICGSTEAKAKLRSHANLVGREIGDFYESFQKEVLRVEDTFWTMLRSSKLDIKRLFLIKSIGDEIWYAYDLNELHEFEKHAAMAKMIEALVSLQTKSFDFSVGSLTDPFDWENEDPATVLRRELPIKITVDLISNALDIGIIRENRLAPHVASLLSPMDKPAKHVQAGDVEYINLCNRLGVSTLIKAEKKIYSSIRTDYIGWEIDRFFRLTKKSMKGAVLLGPEFLSAFDANDLIVLNDLSDQTKHGRWTIITPMIRVKTGQDSFTSLSNNYILARRNVRARELKGIGKGCKIGIVYYKYQENIPTLV